jgi:hypothetical protein
MAHCGIATLLLLLIATPRDSKKKSGVENE